MSVSLIIAAKAISPIVKDIYEGSKNAVQSKIANLNTINFPKKLAKKIAVHEKVKTIWEPDTDISLLSFYYPSKVLIAKKRKIINSLSDLDRKNLVIEGIVGQGKSILLRYLCIQELSLNGSGRIPVFIELRTLSPKKSLLDAIYNSLIKLDIDINDDVFKYLADSGKLVLLLDAFDEVDVNITKDVFNDLEDIVEKYENLQVVVTSRPNDEIQKSRHFSVVPIATLSDTDYEPFLRRLNISSVRIAEIVSAIKNSPSNVSELINTPLMLTLVVIVYESEKEIPTELPEFFEKLFQVVFTRHDRLKGGFERKHYSNLSERKLQELFEAFCFMVMQNKFSRTLTQDQFEIAFKEAQEYSNDCKCESSNFKLDITKVACLMLEEGVGLITFLHKNIMEYHAAAFIKHSADDTAQQFYEFILNKNSSWKEVLKFLQKIDPYRFARFFLIPSYTNLINELGGSSKEMTSESFVKFIDKHLSALSVTYEYELKSEQYIAESYGMFLHAGNIIGLGQIEDCAFDIIVAEFPQITTKESIQGMGLQILISDKGDKHFEVKFNQILKKLFLDKFLERTREIIYSIEMQINELQIIVDLEDKKKLIFKKNG